MKYLVILFSAILFGGCASQSNDRPSVYVKRDLVLIPIDQVHLYAGKKDEVAGPTVSADVEIPAQYRALAVNRIQDGDNLMHEAHVVYKRKVPAQWNLAPSRGQKVPEFGGPIQDTRAEIRPLIDQEALAHIRLQEKVISEQRDVLGKASATINELARQQAALAQAVVRLQAEQAKAQPKTEQPEKAGTEPEAMPDGSSSDKKS